MKFFPSKNEKRTWLAYLGYSLILAVVLLHYLFPTESFRDYMQARLERGGSPFLVSFDRVAASFPFGLRFIGPAVKARDAADVVVLKADSLLVRPRFLSLLSGTLKYLFLCRAYGGIMRGGLYFDETEADRLVETNVELNDINVGDCKYLSELIGREIKGILKGDISFRGSPDSLINGSFDANLILTNGAIRLQQPFLTLESIDLQELEIKAAGKERKMDINSIKLKGKELQGSLTGTMELDTDNIAQSKLSMTGEIKPFATLFQGAEGSNDALQLVKDHLSNGSISIAIGGPLTNIQFGLK